MTVYGWSVIAHVYHEAPYAGASGWVETPYCGERWLDKTSAREPGDLRPCTGQARRCPEGCHWQDAELCPIHSQRVVA